MIASPNSCHHQSGCSHQTRHEYTRPRRTERRELRKIFEKLEFRTLIDRVQKGKRQLVLLFFQFPGTRPLCRDSVCPAANLHSRKTAPRSRRFVCKFCGRGTDVSENSNLTRLEMLDVDYQLIDTEDKSRNYSKVTYKRNSLNRYRNYWNRANGRRTCRNELQ